MTPLASVAALHEQMEKARRAGPLLTNFYPVPDKLRRSIDRGELLSITVGDVLFVLRRDRDFLHLSFVTSAAADLTAALRALTESVAEIVAVDLLGPRERVAELAERFAMAGFRGHRELRRMTKATQVPGQASAPQPAATGDDRDDLGVEFASGGDGAALAAMLESALDRHAEQIPDEEELARAASERKILVVRSGPEIAGLLFFELTGQSSLLRHWLVDPAHRDQRVGARLMRRYFAHCNDVRRFLLWVISDNHNAIDRYHHYGYHQDGLIDQVLIRRPS